MQSISNVRKLLPNSAGSIRILIRTVRTQPAYLHREKDDPDDQASNPNGAQPLAASLASPRQVAHNHFCLSVSDFSFLKACGLFK